MDHPLAVPASDDLSALAWVHEELRKTLESAHKALRRYLRDSEASRHSDLDDVEPTVLRSARQHLHQGVGALELVNIPEGAALLRAAEACVQRFVARPGRLDPAGVEAVERASFALLDYLARRLAGKPAPAVALFAQLRTLLELNGAERVHPADLWSHDWRWRDIPSSPPQEPPTTASLAALQSDFERRLLLLVRANAPEAAQALARDCDAVAATEAASGPGRASPVTFWRIAAAFFEAWSLGAIAADVFVKRTASRVMAQLRNRVKGDAQVSDRLAQDLLFFCARAGDVGSAAPRLAALRKAYPLDPTLLRVDYLEPFYGRFDPAHLQQARKRVAAAKETWNGVAGQELHRLDQLVESFTLVGDSVRRLYPAGEALAGALLHAAMLTARQARAPAPALAMEVATSLLYLDAALEEAEFDPAGQPSRSGRLAERIEQAISGNPPQALEPWMEELYRRVSDRQTMGSVVQELRSALSEVERQTDQFFRHPRENALLAGVPGQLGAMRGVFSVLGVDPAVQASVRMREDIESLLHGETDPHQPAVAAAIQRLAGNLGALGFLIDMLSVQPQMARALFRFNPDSGHLAPVMGRSAMAPDLIERAHAIADAVRRDELPLQAASVEIDALAREREVSRQPVLAATLSAAQAAIGTSSAGSSHEPTDEDGSLRAHVVQALDDFVATASHPVGLEPLGPSLVSRPIPLDLESPAPAFQPTGLEGDDEMRQVFLDESAEVLQQAGEALAALAQAPADLPQITSVRRAFHTLKGSARMVGFSAFGEAAWACEQLYNHWLAEQTPASADLRTFTGDALRYFKAWVAAIAATDDEAFAPEPVVAAAEALRLAGELMRIHLPGEFAPQLVLDAPEVAAPRPGLDTLDLEVPSESGTAPVMEALQATRPLELTPAELAAQLGSPAAAALDALPSALLDIDLGLDAPATGDLPANNVEPEAIATAIASTPVDLDLDSLAAPDAPTPSPAAELPPQWHEDAVVERIEIEALPLAEDSPQSWREPLQTRTTRSDAGTLDPALADTDPDTSQVSGLDPAADLTAEVPADVIAGSTGDASTHAPQDPAAPGEPAVQSDAGADIEPAPALAPPVAQVLRLEDFRPSTSTPTPPEETVDEDEDEDVKVIGPLRLQIPLFNIYLNEADELSRRLSTELAEWSLELHRPVGDRAVMLAHSLAGSSSTVGFADLSQLARLLEHALEQADRRGRGDAPTAELFTQVADEIRRLLHQFAAGFLRSAPEDLLQQLRAWLASQCAPADPASAAADDTESDSSLDTAAQIDIPVDSAAEPAQQVDLTLDLQPIGATPPHSGLQSVFPLPTPLGTSSAEAVEPSEFEADLDQEDQVDAELFPIFAEEADELLPLLTSQVTEWLERPGDPTAATACMRTLHTFKGSARLAGAMRLGELAHRFESAIDQALSGGASADSRQQLEALQQRADHLGAAFEALRSRQGAPTASTLGVLGGLTMPAHWHTRPAALRLAVSPVAPLPPLSLNAVHEATAPAAPPLEAAALAAAPGDVAPAGIPAAGAEPSPQDGAPDSAQDTTHDSGGMAVHPTNAPIDWSHFLGSLPGSSPAATDRAPASNQPVRVRAPLLDRLVNLAGEVSITRTRLEAEVGQIRSSLADLTDNLERLNRQLHDIALQAETQLESRMEAARAAAQAFDPLELDRYTRLQELTRMMAESVNDVATVRSTLQRTLQTTEDELAVQARLTRELQSDLLRTRMIEFESLSERLYRVVRQAAKETGKQVRFDIVGGSIEVDRGVLDRMTAAFEHLLRNCVTHGIEVPPLRQEAGKDPTGSIVVTVEQEGNEVAVEIRDDGAGLDLARIHRRAVEMGLLAADARPTDQELANLIMAPGLSTVAVVTELAGRGVGMDVVRSDVQAMGGRVETRSKPGRGTRFKLVLPLTTVVTQVVILRAGSHSIAVPSNLVELVQRVTPATIDEAYGSGQYGYGGLGLPFFWLGALLGGSGRGSEGGRTLPVVIVRSAQQRVALHVDEVLGSHEVVVKNLGPQLSRLPGLAGMTLLASGAVALIYNPVALATVYGSQALALMRGALQGPAESSDDLRLRAQPPAAPLVLVVDDSLTVRRVTKRLLEREGYRVALAKDGLDALDVLTGERPVAVLSDIEMPRMDGFDLLRNIRNDAALAGMPVVMITSRIAQKHRDIAMELGATHYLGKPYSEEELLGLLKHYVALNSVA